MVGRAPLSEMLSGCAAYLLQVTCCCSRAIVARELHTLVRRKERGPKHSVAPLSAEMCTAIRMDDGRRQRL